MGRERAYHNQVKACAGALSYLERIAEGAVDTVGGQLVAGQNLQQVLHAASRRGLQALAHGFDAEEKQAQSSHEGQYHRCVHAQSSCACAALRP